jgi:NADH-quinone oxidoreductase subunit G
VNDPARPRTPLVDGREAAWDEALDALLLRVGELADLYGEGSLALVGSPRLAHEGAALLPQLAGLLGASYLCWFTEEEEGDRTAAAVSLLTTDNAASLADVREADCIAIVCCDLREEGPMMLLAVRQAWRKGAPVFLVGESSPLEQAQAVSIEAVQLSFLEEAPLGLFERPVVICGTRHVPRLHRAAARTSESCLPPSGSNARCGSFRDQGVLPRHWPPARSRVVAVEADIPAELLERIPFVAALDRFRRRRREG